MRNIVLIVGVIFGLYSCNSSKPKDNLLFPQDNFTNENRIVNINGRDVNVAYKAFKHITYVNKPVDVAYQSLDVYVPVEIDGKQIDASNAPILFSIGVGGYMSVRNIPQESNEGDNRPHFGGLKEKLDGRDLLALGAGYVVVMPGCRGRDNIDDNGVYYGKAPAAIVDLKAAVRYLRHNKDLIPGNTDHIVTVGCSAGGALSALLGTSGDSNLYEPYLSKIGAANESDKIFGCACYSPITDLEHADMAYEWMYGKFPARGELVSQELSMELAAAFDEYQSNLNLQGKNDFGTITAENYSDYLLQYYVKPSATYYINEMDENSRKEYLNKNPWIKWENNNADFTFENYVSHVGRMKGLPSFDDFEMRQPEPNLFGNDSIASRHFTNYSLQYSTGDSNATIDEEVKHLVFLMNAMNFTKNENCAPNWWLRNGSSDPHSSQTVMINLANSLTNNGKEVNTWLFWDGGHCSDYDPEGFVQWIGKICNYN